MALRTPSYPYTLENMKLDTCQKTHQSPTTLLGDHLRTTHADGLDTESEKLQHVRASPHAAVGENRDLLEDLRCVAVDLVGRLNGRGRVLQLAAAVVGNVQAVGAALDRLDGVLDALDALEDDGQICAGPHLVEDVPLRVSVSCVFGGSSWRLTVLGRVEAEALQHGQLSTPGFGR